ncbi:Hypothetical protein D9617_17g047730 [Elsinoe fawcettii]|nr:Hypothetical protein D9617_17g047730 [Elsinoe fawcettii]
MVLKALLVASLLSTTQASFWRRQIDISQQGCNGIVGDYYGKLYCCPGVARNDSDEFPRDSGYCCVGAAFPIPASQFSDCFPNCQASNVLPTSASEVNILPITESQSCRTTIMFTDSDYTSKANAYGASITGPLSINTESAVFTRPVSPTTAADPTTGSGGSSTTPSMTGTGSGGTTSTASLATTGFSGPAVTGSSSRSGSGIAASATSSSSALGAKITSGPMAGAIMVAGGILAAAL